MIQGLGPIIKVGVECFYHVFQNCPRKADNIDYLASLSLPSFSFETSNSDHTPMLEGLRDPAGLDFV